ncbi:hypothetical protein D1007_31029 [Hordeum vulgare]|nr:hypothetical protein D1007_31029 [Hordeum vulgare]
MVVNFEGLNKVQLVVVDGSNECGGTQIWPGSWPRVERASPAVPLHFHALISGVLPTFSGFLGAVLSHYHIHALNLDTRSLVLLSAFTFLCDAFVCVTPSVSLLRHLSSLELISEVQCFGWSSLKVDNAIVPGALYAELLPKAEGLRREWVQVEAVEAGALFQPPPTTATPNREWEREELSDPRITPVLIRLEKLSRAGVTMVMVVHEFIYRWIAPHQRHSHPMWAYTGPSNSTRTQVILFSPHVLHELLRRLTGGNPEELPPNDLPLYSFKAPEAFVADMPPFNEWGLLPDGKRRSPGALTPIVQPHRSPGHVVTPATGVGGAPPPPIVAPRRAGVGGGNRSVVEGTIPTSQPRSRATEFPRQAALAGRKRRSPDGGRLRAPGAPVRKKWMAIDE